MSQILVDWNGTLAVTVASKSRAKEGSYVLFLNLKIRDFDGEMRFIPLELTLQQAYHLLSEFESAKAAVREL
jgi:hypothetical protein